MKKAFSIIELVFIIFILGILVAIAVPRYLAISSSAHQAKLISFVRTLNRTTGEDLFGRSLSSGKNGSIKNLKPDSMSWEEFLSKYIDIPVEINKSDINLSNCGDKEYKKVMSANLTIMDMEYNITCKDGTPSSAPYFQLIREDGEILVSRD